MDKILKSFSRGSRQGVILLAMAVLHGAAGGADLFRDSFDDGDALGWAPYNDSVFRWEQSAFTGAGSGGNLIYPTMHSADFADYTYSAAVTRAGGSSGSFGGLAVRVGPGGAQYLFGVSLYRSYWFARISGGAVYVLADWTPHSALDSLANLLAVSCSGSEFRLYANGRFLRRVTDSNGPVSGGVGLFVQHDGRFRFDDVLADDAVRTDESPLPFVDRFDGTGLAGWFQHGGSIFYPSGGQLCGTGAGGGYLYRCYVSGAFGDFTAVTTVKRTGGSRFYPAGLSLRGQEDGYHSGYLFAVNGNQEYMFSRTDGAATVPLSGWTTHSAIRDSQNTLSAVCTGGSFQLAVNGTVLGTFSDAAYRSGAAGLFVSDNVSARFDSLSLRAAGTGGGIPPRNTALRAAVSAVPNPFRNGTVRLEGCSESAVTVLDTRGRKVAVIGRYDGALQWDGRDSRGRMQPPGIYFVSGAGGSALRIIKAE